MPSGRWPEASPLVPHNVEKASYVPAFILICPVTPAASMPTQLANASRFTCFAPLSHFFLPLPLYLPHSLSFSLSRSLSLAIAFYFRVSAFRPDHVCYCHCDRPKRWSTYATFSARGWCAAFTSMQRQARPSGTRRRTQSPERSQNRSQL